MSSQRKENVCGIKYPLYTLLSTCYFIYNTTIIAIMAYYIIYYGILIKKSVVKPSFVLTPPSPTVCHLKSKHKTEVQWFHMFIVCTVSHTYRKRGIAKLRQDGARTVFLLDFRWGEVSSLWILYWLIRPFKTECNSHCRSFYLGLTGILHDVLLKALRSIAIMFKNTLFKIIIQYTMKKNVFGFIHFWIAYMSFWQRSEIQWLIQIHSKNKNKPVSSFMQTPQAVNVEMIWGNITPVLSSTLCCGTLVERLRAMKAKPLKNLVHNFEIRGKKGKKQQHGYRSLSNLWGSLTQSMIRAAKHNLPNGLYAPIQNVCCLYTLLTDSCLGQPF